MDPQLTGWPLTAEELAWVTKGEYFRKPGHEAQKHLPEMWPLVPTAAHWQAKDGTDANAWIENHALSLEKVQAMKDRIDVVLIGDSITQYLGGGFDSVPWIAPWQKHFGNLKCANLGIGGDRVENVLWRLDHSALDGASPAVAVLLIGTNNTPLISANGVPVAAVAQGIQFCVQNIRARCPKTHIIVVKILPSGKLGNPIYEAAKNVNAALDALKLDADANVHVLDLWSDFTNADGTMKTALYSDGHLHLGADGYELYASKLKPVVEALMKR
jgi:lysophospholipase L1-like esterase